MILREARTAMEENHEQIINLAPDEHGVWNVDDWDDIERQSNKFGKAIDEFFDVLKWCPIGRAA